MRMRLVRVNVKVRGESLVVAEAVVRVRVSVRVR